MIKVLRQIRLRTTILIDGLLEIWKEMSDSLPPTLDFDHHAYLTVSTKSTSHLILKAANQNLSPFQLQPLGSLGSLKDVLLFQLPIPTKQILDDPIQLEKVKQAISSIESVSEVEVMELPKQRSKRSFEGPSPAPSQA